MLMLARIRDHLGHLGLRDFISKDPAYSFPLGMHLQHNPGSFRAVHRKEALENVNDELHGSIIVIYKHYLIEGWALELRRRLLDDQARSFPTSLIVAHE